MTNTYKGNRSCCKLGQKFIVGGCMDEEKGIDYETTRNKQLQSLDINTTIRFSNDCNKDSQRFM